MGFDFGIGRRWVTAIAVSGATAVLLWFGNGLTPWWPLMWIAPLPLFWYSLRTSGLNSALTSALAGFIGSLNLFGYFHVLGIPLPASLPYFGGVALILAAGVSLFRLLAMRGAIWSAMLALPALWVSVDWLRNWTSPHGTSADLAYTQLGNLPFLQLASVTGPWGMSFLLLMTPGAIAIALYLAPRDPKRAGRVAIVVGILLAAVYLFGFARLEFTGRRQTVMVGLIASDAPGNDDVAASGPGAMRLLGEYAAYARRLAKSGAQVVVMPEKIAAVEDQDQARTDALFQSTADDTGTTIVIGELHLSPQTPGTRRYNRAEIYTPHGPVGSYDKEHMLPPFESNLIPGKAKSILHRGSTVWGVAICKDMDFTSTSRAYGNLDAGLMLIPAWDFNLDRTWHGHMAIMRGVEGGFTVARATKDGYLTLSDDRGRIIAERRSDSASFATVLAEVPVQHAWTFFQRMGDWFAWVAVGLLILVLAKAGLYRSMNNAASR